MYTKKRRKRQKQRKKVERQFKKADTLPQNLFYNPIVFKYSFFQHLSFLYYTNSDSFAIKRYIFQFHQAQDFFQFLYFRQPN